MAYTVIRLKQTRVPNLIMPLLVMFPRTYSPSLGFTFFIFKGMYLYLLCKVVNCGTLNMEVLTTPLA